MTIEDRVDALEARVRVLEQRGSLAVVAAPSRGSRDQSISRVLAGASARMRGFGHRWIRARLDRGGMLAYSFGLVEAVCATETVSRQVIRATYAMQRAAAMIEGITVERWVELHP